MITTEFMKDYFTYGSGGAYVLLYYPLMLFNYSCLLLTCQCMCLRYLLLQFICFTTALKALFTPLGG